MNTVAFQCDCRSKLPACQRDRNCILPRCCPPGTSADLERVTCKNVISGAELCPDLLCVLTCPAVPSPCCPSGLDTLGECNRFLGSPEVECLPRNLKGTPASQTQILEFTDGFCGNLAAELTVRGMAAGLPCAVLGETCLARRDIPPLSADFDFCRNDPPFERHPLQGYSIQFIHVPFLSFFSVDGHVPESGGQTSGGTSINLSQCATLPCVVLLPAFDVRVSDFMLEGSKFTGARLFSDGPLYATLEADGRLAISALDARFTLLGVMDGKPFQLFLSGAPMVGFVNPSAKLALLFASLVAQKRKVQLTLVGSIIGQPPQVSVSAPRTVACSSPSGATVEIDGSSSFDRDNDVISYVLRAHLGDGSPQVLRVVDPLFAPLQLKTPLSIGVHDLEFSALDRRFYGSSQRFRVEVTAPPPSARAGPDQMVECSSPSGAQVTLDGSASSDQHGSPLAFSWRAMSGPLAGQDLGLAPTVPLQLPSGAHQFQLSVTDRCGVTAVDSVSVIVRDSTPPSVLEFALVPGCLWPPDHGLVSYRLGKGATFTVKDACDPRPAVELAGAVSSEPAAGSGGGDRTPDIFLKPNEVCLRAERSGTAEERRYTVTLKATDATGNTAERTSVVVVPHDGGSKGSPPCQGRVTRTVPSCP